MGATATVEKRHAFVLREDAVRDLWRAGESVGPARAVVVCSDEVERTFDTLDALLDYANPQSAAILSISLSARSAGFDSTVDVTFSTSRYSPTVRFRATGDEDSVAKLKKSVVDVVDGSEPWYSRFVRVDYFPVALVALLVLWAMLRLTSGDDGSVRAMAAGVAATGLVLILLSFALVGLIVWGMNSLWRRFFPIGSFALGQGRLRYEFDEKVRWVFVGLIVSGAASVVVSVVAAMART